MLIAKSGEIYFVDNDGKLQTRNSLAEYEEELETIRKLKEVKYVVTVDDGTKYSLPIYHMERGREVISSIRDEEQRINELMKFIKMREEYGLL